MIFCYFMIFDAAYLYSYKIEQRLCHSNWSAELFLKAIYSQRSIEWANTVLFISNYCIEEVLQISISVFSMGVSYDLIKSIRNPIDGYAQRLKRIGQIDLLVCVSISIILVTFGQIIPNIVPFNTNDIIIFILRP